MDAAPLDVPQPVAVSKSLSECKLYNNVLITDALVLQILGYMATRNIPYDIEEDGFIDLNADDDEAALDDPRRQINAFVYLVRNFGGQLKKTAIGFVYYYAKLNHNPNLNITYNVKPEFSYEIDVDEYEYHEGDYLKIGLEDEPDGIKNCNHKIIYAPPCHSLDINDCELHKIQFLD